ncbi:basic proline-rich protein-like [Oenanthe melanoleuca]|uniref:basic proline-rich protein-like n=1 Tax=Oenanthe melanoleuca TaxID=2939378 RepID=UPI0024C1B512|nr:basic proline-rich protein-like [Oenanthe melanoleuca]
MFAYKHGISQEERRAPKEGREERAPGSRRRPRRGHGTDSAGLAQRRFFIGDHSSASPGPDRPAGAPEAVREPRVPDCQGPQHTRPAGDSRDPAVPPASEHRVPGQPGPAPRPEPRSGPAPRPKDPAPHNTNRRPRAERRARACARGAAPAGAPDGGGRAGPGRNAAWLPLGPSSGGSGRPRRSPQSGRPAPHSLPGTAGPAHPRRQRPKPGYPAPAAPPVAPGPAPPPSPVRRGRRSCQTAATGGSSPAGPVPVPLLRPYRAACPLRSAPSRRQPGPSVGGAASRRGAPGAPAPEPGPAQAGAAGAAAGPLVYAAQLSAPPGPAPTAAPPAPRGSLGTARPGPARPPLRRAPPDAVTAARPSRPVLRRRVRHRPPAAPPPWAPPASGTARGSARPLLQPSMGLSVPPGAPMPAQAGKPLCAARDLSLAVARATPAGFPGAAPARPRSTAELLPPRQQPAEAPGHAAAQGYWPLLPGGREPGSSARCGWLAAGSAESRARAVCGCRRPALPAAGRNGSASAAAADPRSAPLAAGTAHTNQPRCAPERAAFPRAVRGNSAQECARHRAQECAIRGTGDQQCRLRPGPTRRVGTQRAGTQGRPGLQSPFRHGRSSGALSRRCPRRPMDARPVPPPATAEGKPRTVREGAAPLPAEGGWRNERGLRCPQPQGRTQARAQLRAPGPSPATDPAERHFRPRHGPRRGGSGSDCGSG